MSDVLDTNLGALFNDRPLLARVTRAIQLDRGLDWPDAMSHLHAGVDFAFAHGKPTLRGALEWASDDPEYMAESLTLLERRDAAVAKAYERASEPIMLDRDPRGMVLLDQGGDAAGGTGATATVDIGAALTDPAERERRLARARKLDGSYSGDEGRKRFDFEDRVQLESGKDLVRTLEANAAERAAQHEAQQVAAQLDRTLVASSDKRAKLKTLERQIKQLKGPAASAREAGLEQVQSQLKAAAQEPLRMLDQFSAVNVIADSRGERRQAGAPRWEDVQQRLKLLDRDQSMFLPTLKEMLAGEPAPEPTAPETPPGVHPGSYQLDQRIRERMKELDAPESDYPQIYEQIIREGL